MLEIRQIEDNGNFLITGLYQLTATHGIPLSIIVDQLHSFNKKDKDLVLVNKKDEAVGRINCNNTVEVCLPEFWAEAILDNRSHEYIMATFKDSLCLFGSSFFDETTFKNKLISLINSLKNKGYAMSDGGSTGWAEAIIQYYRDVSEPCEWIIKK